jgi:hypothetical protein
MGIFVVVFAGFQGKKKQLVPKEISIVGVDERGNKRVQSFFLLPPHPADDLPADVRRTNEWLMKNKPMGYGWEGGYIPFTMLESLVEDTCSSDKDALIFTKGSEQTLMLRSILPTHTVIDLDWIKCPKAEDIQIGVEYYGTSCGLGFHNSENCTLEKCFRYLTWAQPWCKQNRGRLELTLRLEEQERKRQVGQERRELEHKKQARRLEMERQFQEKLKLRMKTTDPKKLVEVMCELTLEQEVNMKPEHLTEDRRDFKAKFLCEIGGYYEEERRHHGGSDRDSDSG